MRTRELNKMTNAEVESYLERNDVIFVPVGTVETHGLYPVDVETTIPEAMCKLLAEKADGLYLTGLPYFFCGATTEARGSVQMSVGAGHEYLMELAHSLLRQGFRRQVYLGGHGPSFLNLSPLVNEFFHETGVPIGFFQGMMGPRPKSGKITPSNTRPLGAYRIMDRLDEIVIDPNVKWEDSFDSNLRSEDETEPYNYIFCFGPLSGQVGFYQNRPQCHGRFFGAARSWEDLEALSKEGEALMRATVEELDILGYLEELRALDEKVNKVILPAHGHLPAIRQLT